MRSIELGCGPNEKHAEIGVDRLPGPAVDVVHDLNVRPWPLPTSAYDLILCLNILEHLSDLVGVMEEIHRISVPGASVQIRVPAAASSDFFTDPTHVRAFGIRSFEYFTAGGHRGRLAYSSFLFKIRVARYERAASRFFGPLDALTVRVANRWPDIYESRFGYIYPMTSLYYELEVLK